MARNSGLAGSRFDSGKSQQSLLLEKVTEPARIDRDLTEAI